MYVVVPHQIIALIVISFFSIAFLSAFAQTEELISIKTSEKSYEDGDTIVISGNVTAIILDTPITLQIFYENNLVDIGQIIVAQDGSYSFTLKAAGDNWKKDGTYTIRANYSGKIIETTIEFFSKLSVIETTNIFEVDAGAYGTFDVDYTIRGGTVKNMLIDSEIFALIVIIDSESDGSITLDLPRISIDAKKSDNTDDTYLVFIDGAEVRPEEISTTQTSRILKIEFEEGDSDIEIIGTFVVPEFGSIAILILFLAIISAIFVSSKKFSKFPSITRF
jgi:predicted secreted protein with PEFG-CTERM motif